MTVLPALGAGVSAGFAVAVPLGAMGVLLITTATRAGRGQALAGAAGIATADLVFATFAATGGTAIASALGPYVGTARVIAAFVLIVLAIWMARSALAGDGGAVASEVSARGSFGRFLGLTLLNPTTVVTFAGVIVALPPDVVDTLVERMVFVAGVVGASLSWQVVLAGAGLATGRLLGASMRRTTGLIGAAVILALALVALLV